MSSLPTPGAATPAPDDDPDRDRERLQGTWKTIEMVIEDRRIPIAAFEGRRIIIIEDKYVVVQKDRTLRRGALRIDPSATPKQIDTLPADGPNAGTASKGIYKLADDLLRICFAPAGQTRPTDFTPKPGSGQRLVTDQKEAPALIGATGPVIVAPGTSPASPGVRTTLAHHRDLAQLYGEGESPQEAALDLLRHLILEDGTITDRWHRESLEQVITDVREFLDLVS
jgi:uncharacterized protein (TIGR03067 family)